MSKPSEAATSVGYYGYYKDILPSGSHETFRYLLTVARPAKFSEDKTKIVKDFFDKPAAQFFTESGFLVRTSEPGTFFVFESRQEQNDFVGKNFKASLPMEHVEVKNLKRELSYVVEGEVLTANPQMLRIIDLARHVADADVPVLILGESGVGKEVVAKFIHEQSHRSGPFVKVNCAALPHELLESELFGFEKGAFTGAIRDSAGRFEQANNGTMLLDEIAEMSPHLQAKLLHVLQDGQFNRLGGKRLVNVNVRVIATTNKKIREAVLKGEFRNDLYFRLNVIKVEIPPLRDRREDIILLCTHFIEKYRERYHSLVEQLPKELMEEFLRYDWPGNTRQLENLVKRYLIVSDLDAFPELKMPSPDSEENVSQNRGKVSLIEVGREAAEMAEKEVVFRVLEETGWNRKKAVLRLNISYKALRNKLKKWQVVKPQTTLPTPKNFNAKPGM